MIDNGATPSAVPSVMPLDREAWARELHISNFVNTYYEYRDLQECGASSVLIVGPGQGLDVQVLRWRGKHITTYDIDTTFSPDHVGSVHDMTVFPSKSFDAVIASHVLEHLPVDYLDAAIAELARVASHALVYLPVAGRHGMLNFALGARDIRLSMVWDAFNPFHKPDGKLLAYREGQHFWEVGYRGFRKKDLELRFSKHFRVLKSYRNLHWIPSYNFVLQSIHTSR